MKTWRFKFGKGNLAYDVETDGTLGDALLELLSQRALVLVELTSVELLELTASRNELVESS